MGTVVITPDSEVSGSWTRTGGSTDYGVLTDASDATYLSAGAASGVEKFTLTNPSIPAGRKAYLAVVSVKVTNPNTTGMGGTAVLNALVVDGTPPNTQRQYGSFSFINGELPNVTNSVRTAAPVGFGLGPASSAIDLGPYLNDLQLWMEVTSTGDGLAVQFKEAYVTITYTNLQSAPTSVTPAASSTVTTDVPTLTANLAAHPDGFTVKAQWQVASDSGFTTNVRTLTEDDSALRTSGSASKALPSADQLFQGTWYVRARSIGRLGDEGTWSTGQSFTVAHAPSATITSPTGGVILDYNSGSVSLGWNFSDPSPVDNQTAFQVIIERNDNGASVYDSGKVTGSPGALGTHTATGISSSLKNIPLKWKVRVYDSDDVVGAYSSYSIFSLTDPPTVNITAPTTTATNPSPTVTWTFTPSNSRVQISFRVRFKTDPGGVYVYDSGTISSAATTHTPASPVLANSTNYITELTVTDSANLSATDSEDFATSWTPPAAPTFTVTP